MPNNPAMRREGAAQVPAANKVRRGAAVAAEVKQATASSTLPSPDSSATPGPSAGTVTSLTAGKGINLTPNPITNTGQIDATDPYRVDVTEYGAAGDGVTDDSAAIAAAIEACRTRGAGGIDRVVITAIGTGYTSAPTVGFTGGVGSGVSATALVADVGANGEIGSVKIGTRGTNYRVYGKQCGVTSGNATITCTDTSNLVVGMAADHYTFAAGTTISSINPNVSVTLSGAPTASNAYAQVAFGIPRVTFTGGGGSGAAGEVVVNDRVTLYFPPGKTYRTTLGCTLTGLHNLRVEGPGAILFVDSKDSTGFIVDEFSRSVTFDGIRVTHPAVVFGNSATRDVGCGWRIAGSFVTLLNCEAYNSPEYGVLFSRDRNTGSASYGNRVINLHTLQTCGDGLHVSNGCGGVDIINPRIDSAGDDAIGIVADYGSGNQPSNVTVNGYHVSKGGWRGIAILGAINVQVGPGLIQDMEGYGIEVGTGGGVACQDVTITGFHLFNIGSGGAGAVTTNRTGIVFQNCTGGRLGPGYIHTATGYGYSVDNLTDVQVDLITVLNASLGNFNLGATLTRVSHLYRDSGALKYRGDAGTVTTVAAS